MRFFHLDESILVQSAHLNHQQVAYDCKGKEMDVITVSLLEVEDCDKALMDLKKDEEIAPKSFVWRFILSYIFIL